MSKRDENLVSIEGGAGGAVIVNGVQATPGPFTFEASGREIVAIFSVDPDGLRHLHLPEIVPPDGTYADALKITGAVYDLHVHVPRVVGGKEDVADLNNKVRNIILGDDDTIWEVRGKFAFTVKGGAKDIEIRGVLVGHGTEVDVDLGNHSDQSSDRTEGVTLNLSSDDSSPITWRRINAMTPNLRTFTGQRFKKVTSVPGELRAIFAALWAFLKKCGVPI